MHLNATKFTLFTLLALPLVWGLPVQDDQLIARDHDIIPRNVVSTMSEELQDRGLFSVIPKLLSKIPHHRPWVYLPPRKSKLSNFGHVQETYPHSVRVLCSSRH